MGEKVRAQNAYDISFSRKNYKHDEHIEFRSIERNNNIDLQFRSSLSDPWKTLAEVTYSKPHCKICAHPLKRENSFCNAHRKEFEEVIDRTITAGIYYQRYRDTQNNLSDIIRLFKDEVKAVFTLAPAILFTLRYEMDLGNKDIDYLTYVPKKEKEWKHDDESNLRYNQAEVLAFSLHSLINVPMFEIFGKHNPFSQQGKSESKRKRQALDGYFVKNIDNCRKCVGKNIGVVDDVRTSGWTAIALAKLLKKECHSNKIFLIVAGRGYFR